MTTSGESPRFSVVVPVRDRADAVGRAVAAVLTQTFGDLEIVLVDDGSTDDTVAAARASGDERLRVVRQDAAGPLAACRSGLGAARGRWVVLVDAGTEVSAGWLARLGRLADATGAAFLSCGGDHHHPDGSRTEVVPTGVACLRPGAFTASREVLVAAADRAADRAADGADHGDTVGVISAIGRVALVSVMADDGAPPTVVHTPERLVVWHDALVTTSPDGDELRLHWASQLLDALGRTPIPDEGMLARTATVGGVAAARLGRHDRARQLFGIAARTQPAELRHWSRWAVSCLPPLSRRVWSPTGPGTVDLTDAAAPTPEPATQR
jgi:glycosyltransferase involved in cell wall biosynthesis